MITKKTKAKVRTYLKSSASLNNLMPISMRGDMLDILDDFEKLEAQFKERSSQATYYESEWDRALAEKKELQATVERLLNGGKALEEERNALAAELERSSEQKVMLESHNSKLWGKLSLTEDAFEKLAGIIQERGNLIEQLTYIKEEQRGIIRHLAEVSIADANGFEQRHIQELFDNGYVADIMAAGYSFVSLTKAGEKIAMLMAITSKKEPK